MDPQAPILTVTLNPALDTCSEVPRVVPGPKLRTTGVTMDPGGGGVNVARAAVILGGSATAFVAVAGVTGDMLVRMLEAEGVGHARFDLAGLTRQSFAVVETETGRQYRFGQPGPGWTEADATRMLNAMAGLVQEGQHVVLSGSLPPGVPADTYVRIARLCAERGALVHLDCTGAPMLAALDSPVPFASLRLDRDEAETLAGRKLPDPAAAADFSRSLLSRAQAHLFLIGFGAQGSVLSRRDMAPCLVSPPQVKANSFVGAGDSLVGALVLGLARGWDVERAAVFGIAAAASTVTTPGTRLCRRDQVEAFVSGCRITPLG